MDEFTNGFLVGQNDNGNSNGFFNGDGIWAVLLFALIFGGLGGNGDFGFGGGGNNGINSGFAWQNIDGGIRSIQNGICDSTFALNNTITNGFHGVDRGLCDVSHQISDCCCTTQRSIDNVRFDISRGLCDLGNSISMNTRDIIENQNANYRGLMDFMVQSKLDTLRSENESLRLRVSQSEQNSVLRAAIDASTAEIIRRTGNDCPVPAYVVPNPNCCYGNPLGVGYGNNGSGYNSGGCGCF